jgi:putative transposase
LAIGDGALGFWAALKEAWTQTRCQRCWVRKTANMLTEFPKSIHAIAKASLHEIWMAETKAQAEKAYDQFIWDFSAKYPIATGVLVKERAALLCFYDFPAEHWMHIRTTNPIELIFTTIRHRTTRTRICVSRNTLLGLVLQLALAALKEAGLSYVVLISLLAWYVG